MDGQTICTVLRGDIDSDVYPFPVFESELVFSLSISQHFAQRPSQLLALLSLYQPPSGRCWHIVCSSNPWMLSHWSLDLGYVILR